MKSLIVLVFACVLAAGSAVAQQTTQSAPQYPNSTQTSPQYPNSNQYPSPNQYPNQNSNSNQYPNSTQTDSQYPNSTQSSPQYPNNTVTTQNGALPAGTQLSIRTDEEIVADQDSVGRTYTAEIARDVVGDNGQILIPKNSPARLTVENVGNGTAGVQSTQVALALQSVTVNGMNYMVQTDTATQSGDRGIGANKRTATMVGGGAVLGTVIGAVAGGGKGAVLGGILGGVAGGTAQVLTRGKEVKVPAESVLTFRLDQPMQLQQQQQSPQY